MSFLAAMCGMDVSKVLRNSALLLVFAVGFFSLFSYIIVRQCGRQFATTTKKKSGGQLPMVQNLSWQVAPPWFPPKIEEKRVASGPMVQNLSWQVAPPWFPPKLKKRGLPVGLWCRI